MIPTRGNEIKGRMEYLNTRFPLPTLLCGRYSVKLMTYNSKRPQASQLMPGCYLPPLYVGVECSLLNNVSMCERFMARAAVLHTSDKVMFVYLINCVMLVLRIINIFINILCICCVTCIRVLIFWWRSAIVSFNLFQYLQYFPEN